MLDSTERRLVRVATAGSTPFWSVLTLELLFGGALIGGLLADIDRGLQQADGLGMVALELAGSAQAAATVVGSWGAHQLLEEARGSVLLDLLFIPFYAGALAAGLLGLARGAVGGRTAALASLALLPLLAAAADLAENAVLWRMLSEPHSDPGLWPAVATGFALLKFGLLLVAVHALVGLLLFALFARSTRGQADGPDGVRLASLDQVRKDERLYLRSRRRQADGVRVNKPAVGLASSGGGIRSATVNLGVVQVLLDHDQFKQVDYHSTVSGGGYLGTALASLLSFRAPRDGEQPPQGEEQYRFAGGDKPYFDAALRTRLPLPVARQPVDANQPERVSRDEVMAHLRAFGEFLVRRRRLFSRDLMRAAGTVIGGMAATLFLFLLTAAVMTMAVLLAFDLAASLPTPLDCLAPGAGSVGCPTPAGTLTGALYRQLGQGGAVVVGFGLLVGLTSMAMVSWLAGQLPESWLRRDGDTLAETREYRALWVVGLMVSMFAFGGPRLLLDGVGLDSGALSPALFMAGVAAAAGLAYVAQTLVSYDWVENQVSMDPDLWRSARSFTSAAFGLGLALAAIVTFFGALPEVVAWLVRLGLGADGKPVDELYKAGAGGLLSALLAGLLAWKEQLHGAERRTKRQEVGTVAKRFAALGGVLKRLLLGVAVVLFVAAVLMVAALLAPLVNWWLMAALHLPMAAGVSPYFIGFTVGVLLLILLGNYAMDFNRLSLHHFYRDRLVEAYMRTLGSDDDSSRRQRVKRDNSAMRLWELHGRTVPTPPGPKLKGIKVTAVAGDTGPWSRIMPSMAQNSRQLSLSGAVTSAPYLLYSTCLNLTTDRDMSRRTRKSDIFLFSKLYCGSCTTGFVSTPYYRSGNTEVAAAMTISGAAADSAIGRGSFFAQSFAATLFNVRLGQWLENPRYRGGDWAYRMENGVFWPMYLLFEALGISDCRHRLVHLSDGGHTGDNLGLIPLLQRRCRLIIAVDAEQDVDYGFGSYLNAKRYARVDDNTLITMDLDRLRPDPKTGLSADPFTVGRIEYRDSANRVQACGILVLLKSSLTADMPGSLRRYRERYPNFPHDTTVDQFFTEDQFEAYRMLGQSIAEMLVQALPALLDNRVDCDLLWHQYGHWLALRE